MNKLNSNILLWRKLQKDALKQGRLTSSQSIKKRFDSFSPVSTRFIINNKEIIYLKRKNVPLPYNLLNASGYGLSHNSPKEKKRGGTCPR